MIDHRDIATALGRDTPSASSPQAAQWDMWIADALLLIRHRLGDPALLDQEALDYVVREAVVAMVRRPDDATTVDVSVDDGRVLRTYSTSPGKVFIRPEWWDMLSPLRLATGAYSIRPRFEADSC